LFTWIKSTETPAYATVPQRREEDIELGSERSDAQVRDESRTVNPVIWKTDEEREEFNEKR
jgi:hypothetical protein